MYLDETHNPVAVYRLFQLISPSLPIGGFTYSQGLEWAVEAGWVSDRVSMQDWLANLLFNSVAILELPLIDRFYAAIQAQDEASLEYYSALVHSSRETKELRAEERQRGHALITLLRQLGIGVECYSKQAMESNQLLGLCVAGIEWGIPASALKQGYLWSWAENLVMAGVKLVPLGQTDGQKTLMHLSNLFTSALEQAAATEDWMIGSFTPSVSIASSLHETQYTRLFRS